MSSTGQAFVKSFARRSQTNSTNARAAQTVPRSANPPRAERPEIADGAATDAKAAEMESAELWVDSFDDTTHRLDRAADTALQPHLRSSSQQSTHTAYDSAGIEPANGTGTDDRITSEPPESLESPEAILAARVAKVLLPIQAKTNSPPTSIDPETDKDFEYQNFATAEAAAVDQVTQPNPKPPKDFQSSETLHPSWEVEVFDIPQSVADLFFEETLFQDLSDRMKEASEGGLRTMLMTSALTGEGRTTVAIGVALAAASSGLRVALVDGDLAEPTLAEELRLDLDHSWVESIRRGVPIKEIAVHAVEDNLTLIPLLPTDSGRQATAVECAQMIESLKSSFDLIVVDGPTADARDIRMLGSAIDSVIIVHDVNQSSDAAADLLAARLQRAGIDGVGIVENFA